MISELERINALNLEPSLPKNDDGNRSMTKYSQDRDKVKNEFQQFLSSMRKHDEQKASSSTVPSSGSQPGEMSGRNTMPKPGGSTTASVPNMSTAPAFQVDNQGPSTKNLLNILEDMLKEASKANPSSLGPEWPEAKHPSYKEVLGRPSGPIPELQNQGKLGEAPVDTNTRQGHMSQGPHGGAGGGGNNRSQMQGNDQMQAQMRPVGPGGMQQQGMPQQQGYVMQGGPPQGGQPQMQMYMAGPQGMQPMPNMQMQGQHMVFQPGMGMVAMGGQNQQMAVPMAMMGGPQQGGPNAQGMPMQQFDGNHQQGQVMYMPMMMPQDGSGNMPQNMMMQPQGMQGYPQQGGNPGNPQGGYMMQQQMFQQQGNS